MLAIKRNLNKLGQSKGNTKATRRKAIKISGDTNAKDCNCNKTAKQKLVETGRGLSEKDGEKEFG